MAKVAGTGSRKAGDKKDAVFFELQGAEEVVSLVKLLPQKIAGKITRNAFHKAAKPVVKLYKQEIPRRVKDNKWPDIYPQDAALGKLRKSIFKKVKTYRSSGTTVLVVGPRIGDKWRADPRPGSLSYTLMPRLTTIAVAIERGWKGRTKIPFTKTAKEKAPPVFLAELKKTMTPAIVKEANRLRNKFKGGKKLSSSEIKASPILGSMMDL